MNFIKEALAWILSERGYDLGLLILRVGLGTFMMTHGLAKINNFAELSQTFADPVGWGAKTSLILIIFAEFVCSILVVLGLGTRLAVIPIIVGMIVAAFFTYPQFAFGKSEMALVYLVGFTAIFFMGAGKYSLDHLILRWLQA